MFSPAAASCRHDTAFLSSNRAGPIGNEVGSPCRRVARQVSDPALRRVPMRISSRWWLALAFAAVASPAAAQQSGNWSTYGGNDWNQRYSQLKTITTTNVSQLVPRMVFQTGIAKLGSFENTP